MGDDRVETNRAYMVVLADLLHRHAECQNEMEAHRKGLHDTGLKLAEMTVLINGLSSAIAAITGEPVPEAPEPAPEPQPLPEPASEAIEPEPAAEAVSEPAPAPEPEPQPAPEPVEKPASRPTVATILANIVAERGPVTIKEAAEEIGVTRPAIASAAKKHGVPLRAVTLEERIELTKQAMPAIDRPTVASKLKALVKERGPMTAKEAAAEIGCARESVAVAAKRLGIDLRPLTPEELSQAIRDGLAASSHKRPAQVKRVLTPPDPSRPTSKQIRVALVEMTAEKGPVTAPDVAAALGCSSRAVRDAARAEGIELRRVTFQERGEKIKARLADNERQAERSNRQVGAACPGTIFRLRDIGSGEWLQSDIALMKRVGRPLFTKDLDAAWRGTEDEMQRLRSSLLQTVHLAEVAE